MPRIMKLVGGAVVSAWLSVLIAAICARLGHPDDAVSVFLLTAGSIVFFLRSEDSALHRFDAGFVFTFFMFAPLGRVLQHQEASTYLLITLLSVVVAAYFLEQVPSKRIK